MDLRRVTNLELTRYNMRMVMCLQIVTIVCIGQNIITFVGYRTHRVNEIRLTKIHTAEPLVP
jgi:hypothetical protein